MARSKKKEVVTINVIDPFNMRPEKYREVTNKEKSEFDKAILQRIEAKYQYDVAQAVADEFHKKVKEMEKLVASLCDHRDREEHSKYFEGNYNDRASTRYWSQCPTCGWKSEGVEKTHSWYG